MTTTAVDQRASGVIPADTFGNRLILARAEAGHLSIREAAERCLLGRGAWQHWERGGRPQDYDDLVSLIAERLGIDKIWLRDGGPLASAPPRLARWQRRNNAPHVTVTYPGDLAVTAPRRDPTRPADTRPAGYGGPTRPGRTARTRPTPANPAGVLLAQQPTNYIHVAESSPRSGG